MSGKNADELVIAKNGSWNVAAFGSDLPTEDDDLDSDLAVLGFVDCGYATENGVTLAVTPDIAEFPAWQTRHPVRRELNAQEIMASTELEQWNADNMTLAFGGGEVTEPNPGIFRYDFPTDTDALDERSLVIDWADGDKLYRAVFPKGNVTEPVSTNLTRNALGILPIGFKVLGEDGVVPAYVLTDDPNFGTAS